MLASTWSGKLNSPPLDGWLESLIDDWYAAHKVFDAAVIAHDRAGEKDPEKKVEMERAEQRTDALYEQMVNAPAQGLRGIYAKMRAAVFPDQWETFHAGEIASLDDDINPAMLYSLVADVNQSETFPFQLFFLDRGAPLKKTWNQDNSDDRPKWP